MCRMRRSGRKSSRKKTLDKKHRSVYNKEVVECSSQTLLQNPLHDCITWRGFLTPVLTTSHDGKVVKTANLGIAKTMCDNSRLTITRHTQAQSSEEATAFAFFHGKQTKSVKLLDSLWFSDPCNAADYHFDYLDVEVNILSTLRMAFSSFFSVRCAYIRIIIVSSSCTIQRAAVLMSTSAS